MDENGNPKKKGDGTVEKEVTNTCHAVVETSPWKPDDETMKSFCGTSNFSKCPRMEAFMNYQHARNTLNVKTS